MVLVDVLEDRFGKEDFVQSEIWSLEFENVSGSCGNQC